MSTSTKSDKETGKNPNHPGLKIHSPLSDYLQGVLDKVGVDNPGANASYIPELKNANGDHLGVCLSTVDGYVYKAGATEVEFTIQSVSKPFVYALAIREHGLDWVLNRVDVEPSGEAFNELSLEGAPGQPKRPKNPMINAGAITTHSLIGEGKMTVDERFETIRKGLSEFAGRELSVNESAYHSEITTAYRNLAIGNMLRNYDAIKCEPDDAVKGYTRQCAIQVTARDLALMAATFAHGGKQPCTGKQVIEPHIVRQVLSVTSTCGMYNEAGNWVARVGYPAKSGVSGCIMGILPGQMGIASFSPHLDAAGNSVRGVRIAHHMSDDMGLHMMNAPPPARTVVRRDYLLNSDGGEVVVVLSLMGTVNFTSAERVLRLLASRTNRCSHKVSGFVLDMDRVDEVSVVAGKMITESMRRLRQTGHTVYFVDPDARLGKKPNLHEVDPDSDGVDHLLTDLSMFKDWKEIPMPDSMTIIDE